MSVKISPVTLPPPAAPPPPSPLNLLRQVESGVAHLTVPAIPGTHDSGVSKFTIRPGTQILIALKVRDGELVPGQTRITFSPKLDNFAWTELGTIELLADGRVMGRVDGWRDQDLTQKLFDVDRLPLEMPALFDMLTKPKDGPSGSAEPAIAEMSKLQLALTDCVLAPGKMPLLDKSVELSIGGAPAKKQLVARAALNAAELGNFDELCRQLSAIDPASLSAEEENTLLDEVLPRAIALAAESDERHLLAIIALILSVLGIGVFIHDVLSESSEERAGRMAFALRSRLKRRTVEAPKNRTVVDITADMRGLRMTGDFVFSRVRVDRKDVSVDAGETRGKGTLTLSLDANGDPRGAALDLSDLAISARSIEANDVAGSTVAAKNITASGGRLALDFDFKNEKLKSPVVLSLPNADLDIEHASLAVGADAPIVLARGHVKGSFSVSPDGLALDLQDADLNASIARFTAGQGGSFRIGYTAASVRGRGAMSFQKGVAHFTGALLLSGAVDDAKIGKPGSALFVDVASGTKVDLSLAALRIGADGVETAFSGRLDVVLDAGEILLSTGSRLKLARGSRATVDVREARLDAAGATVRAGVELHAAVSAPISGRTTVKLDEVSFSPDGKLLIDGVRSTIDLRVTKIAGKLDLPATPARAPVTAPRVQPKAAAKTEPLADLLNAVKDATVVLTYPLPAGDYGTGDVLTIKKGTVATLTVTIRDGKVVFDKTSLRTSRDLDLPGPFNSSGLYVNEDGDFVASIDYMKDINLHWFNDDMRLGKTLPDVLAQVKKMSGGGSGSASSSSSVGLSTLARHGVAVEIRDINFNERAIHVDANTSLRFGAGTSLAVEVRNGIATLKGSAILDHSRIGAQGAEIAGLSGRTDLDVTLTDSSVDARVTLDGLSAETARFSSMSVKSATLWGNVHLANKTMTATLSRVTGVIEGVVAGAEVSAEKFDGTISVDGRGAKGALVVSNVRLRMPDLQVDAAGLRAKGRASGTGSGVLSFDTQSHVSFAGALTLDAALDSGVFASGPLSLQMQNGTRAALTLNALNIGRTTTFAGSAEIALSVAGGTLKLPSRLTLDIAAGSAASLTLSEIGNDRARGKLHLRATTKMTLPKGGVLLAEGVRLVEVKGHRGVVDVVIDDIVVEKDGSFVLSDVRVKVDVKARQVRTNAR